PRSAMQAKPQIWKLSQFGKPAHGGILLRAAAIPKWVQTSDQPEETDGTLIRSSAARGEGYRVAAAGSLNPALGTLRELIDLEFSLATEEKLAPPLPRVCFRHKKAANNRLAVKSAGLTEAALLPTYFVSEPVAPISNAPFTGIDTLHRIPVSR
ncbi:hypothetical protein NKH09_30710, partial [Mesorhizobium sp. M1339]|uniref:hypothetical protein n=1 Tax=Mesorhizobium sp. M1339 TaxID=2957086 RepID=UPI0033376A71